MIKKLFLFTICLLAAASSVTVAINCNFIKIPVDEFFSRNSITHTARPRRSNTIDPFECEESLYEGNDTFVPLNIGSRNQFEEDDDHLCSSTTKPLVPKELNNVYNKLIKIQQDHSFVQTIYITECTNPKSDCSAGNNMPGQKIICRQHYVKISLMAVNEVKKTYEEQFYYPSACSCQILTKKKKN